MRLKTAPILIGGYFVVLLWKAAQIGSHAARRAEHSLRLHAHDQISAMVCLRFSFLSQILFTAFRKVSPALDADFIHPLTEQFFLQYISSGFAPLASIGLRFLHHIF